MTTLVVSGDDARRVFTDEAGGHRWQRIPPTERYGRVHTSTITVAVLDAVAPEDVRLKETDIEVKACRGSGPGGQHRNKTESAIQMTHRPTGVTVRCETERSQYQNRQIALQLLAARVAQSRRDQATNTTNAQRAAMVGSGERGDKRRTIRTQDNQVKDHITGRTWRYDDYVRGNW